MFKALQPLLANCASLTTALVANDDGTITVTVIPKAKKDGEANASLNTPLVLTGTAEELDQEFANLLGSYVNKRKSLEDQLEATEAVLEAAKKEATTKASKAVKSAGKPGGKAEQPSSDDGEGGDGGDNHDDDTGGSSETGGAQAPSGEQTATAPATTVENVWG